MRGIAAMALISCMLGSAAVGQERRELGAHQHGHGTLNIGIEGTRVSMELEVPAADIVGFEHAAKTKKDRAAVEKAKGQLSAPLALFTLPAAAGCSVKEATVKIEGGSEKKPEPKDSKAKAGAKGHDHDHHGEHSEFHAEYTLECSSAEKLTSIEFPYFRTFSGADELEVTVITAKGQSKFEVKRGKPRVDLAGVM